MRDIIFRVSSLVFVGCIAFAATAGGQTSGQDPVSAARLACQPAQNRVGTDAWLRRLGPILSLEKQEALRPGRLNGFVLDPAGKPLEDVFVVLSPGWDPPGDTTKRRTIATSRTGEFVFDSISADSYILHIRRLGLDAQWREYRGLRGISDTLCIEMRVTPYALGRS